MFTKLGYYRFGKIWIFQYGENDCGKISTMLFEWSANLFSGPSFIGLCISPPSSFGKYSSVNYIFK